MAEFRPLFASIGNSYIKCVSRLADSPPTFLLIPFKSTPHPLLLFLSSSPHVHFILLHFFSHFFQVCSTLNFTSNISSTHLPLQISLSSYPLTSSLPPPYSIFSFSPPPPSTLVPSPPLLLIPSSSPPPCLMSLPTRSLR